MYNGYNLQIENNQLPNAIIVPGTYQITKAKRIVNSWKDANGKTHFNYYPLDQVSITFDVKERTLEQQNSIKWLFAKKDNITIFYYDDETDEYKVGTFKMNDASLSHSYDGQKIYYAATTISFEEY